MIPELVADGFLVAGDAAAMCLAAGIWLEGVNFAIGSGLEAGRAALAALERGDTSARGLGCYRRRLAASFVLQDHHKLRALPHLVLSERIQEDYPGFLCNVVERLFHVDNPAPKPGLRRIVQQERKRARISLRDLVKDATTGGRALS
jgi:electron transfer flavoprotein-quinone oxidoreductase